MRVDEHLVFTVHRITVRCNECPRQMQVYVATGSMSTLSEALLNVGWSANDADEHYCTEHAE